jgi:hypothetical protein
MAQKIRHVVIVMQTFVGYEMDNKIDPFFSLCTISKGAKK